MKKIIVTGGDGRFASILKKTFNNKNIYYLNKKDFDITSKNSIQKKITYLKPDIIINIAAVSRPVSVHGTIISKSINVNIIGTCNLVQICAKNSIKLVHMSTHYVYPCLKGNYSEKDALLPANNYSWSKLGGECAVQMYLKNSLIIRVAMTETPFPYKEAYTNIKSNFLSHQQVAKILPKLLKFKGIINVGGKEKAFTILLKEQIKKLNLKNLYLIKCKKIFYQILLLI